MYLPNSGALSTSNALEHRDSTQLEFYLIGGRTLSMSAHQSQILCQSDYVHHEPLLAHAVTAFRALFLMPLLFLLQAQERASSTGNGLDNNWIFAKYRKLATINFTFMSISQVGSGSASRLQHAFEVITVMGIVPSCIHERSLPRWGMGSNGSNGNNEL